MVLLVGARFKLPLKAIQGLGFMRKILLTAAILTVSLSGLAFADGYDLTHKNITEISVKDVREANDQIILYNSATGVFSRVDAISFSS